jgi:hypothetical protein
MAWPSRIEYRSCYLEVCQSIPASLTVCSLTENAGPSNQPRPLGSHSATNQPSHPAPPSSWALAPNRPSSLASQCAPKPLFSRPHSLTGKWTRLASTQASSSSAACAIDYFGDGSFYLLNAPGHIIGNLSALARTSVSPDILFMLLGGDVALHASQLRPSIRLSSAGIDCTARLRTGSVSSSSIRGPSCGRLRHRAVDEHKSEQIGHDVQCS